jgi:hypothetical protein
VPYLLEQQRPVRGFARPGPDEPVGVEQSEDVVQDDLLVCDRNGDLLAYGVLPHHRQGQHQRSISSRSVSAPDVVDDGPVMQPPAMGSVDAPLAQIEV